MPRTIRDSLPPVHRKFLCLACLPLLAGCGATAFRTVTAPAAIPLTITSVTPNKVPAGGGTVSLTVTGTGFTGTTAVRVGGLAEQASLLSSTQIAVTVPAAQTANGAILAIAATDGLASSAPSLFATLEIDNPTPQIALLSPTSLPLATAPATVIVKGSGFLPSTVIQINGSPRAAAFSDGTQMSVALNASDTATAGQLSVTAANPAPTLGVSGALDLLIDNPVPGVSTLTPSSVLAYGNTPVLATMSGTGFTPNSTVLVNGIAREAQYLSTSRLAFQLTVADQRVTGPLLVTVVNPSPGGGRSAAATLTVTDTVYASTLPGVASDSVLTPGAQVTGADVAAPLQAVLGRGGIHLIVDGRFTLFSSLILSSNDRVEILPGSGLIMGPGSNCEMFLNAHSNAPVTPSGTGGFLVSNQIDHDLSLINHGTLNFNSTGGAVTGSDSLGGNNVLVAHKVNPSTGKSVNGLRFVGVNGLTLVPGEMYDSGTFTVTFANDSNVDVGAGYIHHPLPTIQGKNTDGLHFFGPDSVVHIHDLDIASGDDAIGLNADDIQEPETYNFSGTAYEGVLHGPINKVDIKHVRFHEALSGIRLLSLTELIDQITINDVSGITLGPSFVATKFFASGGLGNFGTVSVDSYNVMSLNNLALRQWDPIQAAFELDGKWKSFSATNLRYTNPATPAPLLRFGSGTMQSLALSNLSIDDQAGSAMAEILQIGGHIEELSTDSIQAAMPLTWAGSIFSGTQPPDQLTIAGYSGPPALLAPNWSNTPHSGNAFSSAAGSGVQYALRSTFNEGILGAPLPGTAPATGSGTWLQASGAPPTFVAGGILVANVNAADATVIDTGLADGTISYTFAAFEDGWTQLALRYTDRAHYIAIILRASHLEMYDITEGVLVEIGRTVWSPPLNSPLSVTLRGHSITLSDGVNPPVTGNLPANTANLLSTRHGFLHFGGGYSPTILSAITAAP